MRAGATAPRKRGTSPSTMTSTRCSAARANANVVVIGTPPDSHASYCLKAFGAGAHVICEKPFVSSLEEADRVIAASEAAGRRIALNHEFREMPIFRALRDAAAPKDIV